MALRLRRAFCLSFSLLNHHRHQPKSIPSISSHLLPLAISNPSPSSTVIPSSTQLTRSFTSTSTLLRKTFDPETDEIGPDTVLFEGCDYNHWLITVDFPKDSNLTREQMIETYVNTAAQIFGSVEEAKKKIYALSTTTYQGFQVECSEETSEKFKNLPGVVFVLPDSYLDPVNKEYGGDKYVNGEIFPRPPPVHYGRRDNRDRRRRDNYGPPPQQNYRPPPQQNYGPPPPQQNYGPPPPQQNYGPPPPQQNYGPPPPQQNYGPPPPQQNNRPPPQQPPLPQQNNRPPPQQPPLPQQNNRPPPQQQNYGPPPPQQQNSRPSPPQQKPYGPPPPQQNYGPPPPQLNYGPPPLLQNYGPPPPQQNDRPPAQHQNYVPLPQQNYGPGPHQNYVPLPPQNYGPGPHQNYGPPPQQSYVRQPQQGFGNSPNFPHRQNSGPQESGNQRSFMPPSNANQGKFDCTEPGKDYPEQRGFSQGATYESSLGGSFEHVPGAQGKF